MPQTNNRTKWPVNGGALSVQPGWFPGHASALIYINIGIQEPGHEAPKNMSHPVHPVIGLEGPSNDEYPGQFCIPQIGMPPNLNLQVGDNITIQVVEIAQHGAALYSVSVSVSMCRLIANAEYACGLRTKHTANKRSAQCSDVTLAEPEEVEEVNEHNCYNSSNIGFSMIYTSPMSSGTAQALSPPSSAPAMLAISLILMVGSAWI